MGSSCNPYDSLIRETRTWWYLCNFPLNDQKPLNIQSSENSFSDFVEIQYEPSFCGFMYSADADGSGRTRTDADGRGHFYKIIYIFFFCVYFLAYIDLRGQLERDPESDRLGPPPPPRIMILWRSIESTTQIAQLRWRNVANVGMVAVGTTTLAQRRHGRRRHNYGGATSFSQRWANVFLPTICQRCRPCWKKSENTCSLIFWRGICFPGVKYKISHKNGFELKYTIDITYLWR